VGKPRTASGRRRFDHVSQHSAARSSWARHMPNGASPWRPLRLDSDNCGHALRRATRAASANVQHWPGSDSDESHLDARLGCQPHLWATPVFKWTSRRPGPVGATPAFGRHGNPTEFSDSDRRGPWARDSVPGRNIDFNSSSSVAIPPTARWARRTNRGHLL
jgi:hypothetical protein